MSSLSSFPITSRWPAAHPDRLQLYSLNTPNGVKVSIMLEEIGLPYEPHLVDFGKDDQKTPEFLSLNPNGKIPGDHRSGRPGRQTARPVRVRRDPAISRREDRQAVARRIRRGAGRRSQWVHFQMGAIGPMFGQVGFFNKFAGKDFEDKRPRDRYVGESKRLLDVMDKRLDGRRWFMGDDYTIADISMLGWVRNLINFYEARELVAFDTLKHVPAWLERGLARPAVQRGLNIPKRG